MASNQVGSEVVKTVLPSFSMKFGQETSLAISIVEANFVAHALPAQGLAMVEMTAIVSNMKYDKPIAGKLRFPLPEGARVVRYAFEVSEGTMVDATALSKRKAAEVSYKERERGRDVSSTESVEGNLFETSVFPLLPKAKQRLIIVFVVDLVPDEEGTWKISLPFRFDKEAAPETLSISGSAYPQGAYTCTTSDLTNKELPSGADIVIKSSGTCGSQAEVALGVDIGQQHFAALLPVEVLAAAFSGEQPTAAAATQLCVLWDTSQSCKPKDAKDLEERLAFFEEVAKSVEARGGSVAFTVYTFCTSLRKLGEGMTAAQAKDAVSAAVYDGGTQLSVLDEVFTSDLSKLAAVVLVSDGVDNLGGQARLPAGVDALENVPVHVLTPPSDLVNDSVLRALSSSTKGTFQPLSRASAQIVGGSKAEYVVTKVSLECSDLYELLMDESFSTVPDWRLKDAWWPARAAGALVTGTMPAEGEHLPDVLVATVFSSLSKTSKQIRVPLSGDGVTSAGAIGRLVGAVHCRQMIDEARAINFDPEFARQYIEELSIRYNVASDETSLLLLHKAEQFLDNGLDCPKDHPAHKKWLQLKKANEKSAALAAAEEVLLKLEKLQRLQPLADKLLAFHLKGNTTAEKEELAVLEETLQTMKRIQKRVGALWQDSRSTAERHCDQLVQNLQSVSRALESVGPQKLRLEERANAALKTFEGAGGSKSQGEAHVKTLIEEIKGVQVPAASVEKDVAEVVSAKEHAVSTLSAEAMKDENRTRDLVDKCGLDLSNLILARKDAKSGLQAEHDKNVAALADAVKQAAKDVENIKEAERQAQEAQQDDSVDKPQNNEDEDDDDSDFGEDELLRSRAAECEGGWGNDCALERCCMAAGGGAYGSDLAWGFAAVPDPLEVLLETLATIRGELSSLRSQVAANVTKLTKLRAEAGGARAFLDERVSKTRAQANKLIDDLPSEVEAARRSHWRNIKSTHESQLNMMASFDARNARLNRATQAPNESVALAATPLLNKIDETALNQAYKIYIAEREKEDNATSPSFYVYMARMLHEAGASRDMCVMVISNALEMHVQDVQMFRSVSYFLLEVGAYKEAIGIFRRVQDKAPAEPQSYIDLGMALFFHARTAGISGEELAAALKESAQNLADAITGSWASRFHEIEWVALLWTNWVCGYSQRCGHGDVWPASLHRSFEVPALTLDLVCALAWDTDRTDIDLHLYEPDGSHVYYGQRDSPNGGHCSRDFTQGYGPEVYMIKEGLPGVYNVKAKYYGSHQATATTGATSSVLWTVKHFGHADKEEFSIKMIRMDSQMGEMDVMKEALFGMENA